ncbi:hypothetical protein FE782_07245 [Paenibacillus antri]|uniref:Uncharacterized protein n=1 Tax=Paenibacillus antri TaxID=2582848 RepID=A0A5R9GG72_9BACL|nr:hypothetical protein [Paenibacillus antri]TLS53150.1 hypothetical protein FE782_07245 [Paenibacillus antri]
MTTLTTRHLLTETIIDELQLLPELLRKAEMRYYSAQHALAEKRGRLADAESAWPLADAAPYNDEAARLAAFRAYTGPLHADIRQAQADADRLKAEVDFLLRRHDNYRVMATLLANG